MILESVAVDGAPLMYIPIVMKLILDLIFCPHKNFDKRIREMMRTPLTGYLGDHPQREMTPLGSRCHPRLIEERVTRCDPAIAAKRVDKFLDATRLYPIAAMKALTGSRHDGYDKWGAPDEEEEDKEFYVAIGMCADQATKRTASAVARPEAVTPAILHDPFYDGVVGDKRVLRRCYHFP